MSERDELVRLGRQLRQVQMDRDILPKATAWFAGRSDSTSSMSSDSRWRTKPTYPCAPFAACSVYLPAGSMPGANGLRPSAGSPTL